MAKDAQEDSFLPASVKDCYLYQHSMYLMIHLMCYLSFLMGFFRFSYAFAFDLD